MISLGLQTALEREVVGQQRAIDSVVRALTVGLSGLSNPDIALGMYLLVGPSGTGKTHLARTLARQLHGDTRRLAVVDCAQLGGREEWASLTRQLQPHFRYPAAGRPEGVVGMEPLSILLIERIERTRPELVQALIGALETGHLTLGDGKVASLRGCLVLLTSNLCAREIFDAGRQEIGFSSGSGDLDENERAQVYQVCASAAEKLWGVDLLGHLDDLVVFHRLSEGHQPFILERLLRVLNHRLAPRRIRCELDERATAFLLDRASRFLRHGAWALVKAFRRFVVFPVADLAAAGRIQAGSVVRLSCEEKNQLRVTVVTSMVTSEDRDPVASPPSAGEVNIPVSWDELAAECDVT